MQREPVLVPLDGSATAAHVLPYARALAHASERPLRLVSVVTWELVDELFPPPTSGHDPHEWLRVQRQRYLDETAERLRADGVSVTTVARATRGGTAEEILSEAASCDAALIVIATHGRSGLNRWMLGSVAVKIARLATIPTILVTPKDGDERVRFAEIAVPLDGSELAERALAPAANWAEALNATLHLVRVEPRAALLLAGYGGYIDLVALEQAIERESAAYLEGVRARLPFDLTVHTHVLIGDPASELTKLSEHHRVDLFIMTTHGRGGFERAVLGSVADRIIRSGVPVLLIPTSDADALDTARTAADASRTTA
jgi:nucleotide-binding universal stress UspA family protein